MPSRDRLALLLDAANITLNGIDFVEVATPDEVTLRVHFLTPVPLAGTITAVSISGGETIRTVSVVAINNATDWSFDLEGRPLLTLHTRGHGDFSMYLLALTSASLDPFFSHTRFSFKAGCPSDMDCREPAPDCPPDDGPAPAIDYLAKDFLSFRRALSDFSAQRYPGWQERSEADFGVMFMEALSAIADNLSYTQDRVAAEATLDGATQRRSLVRHARLVDYEPRPATCARVWLQFDVSSGPLPVGLLVHAQGPDGSQIDFEVGTGLRDTTAYVVDPRWNRHGPNPLLPYWWDDSQRCLTAGSTDMWLHGWGHQLLEGMTLLVDTAGPTPPDPPVRAVVHLVSSKPGLGDFAVEEVDPLVIENGQPTRLTHVRWSAAEALQHDHDLTRTTVAGNLVPATQARRFEESFVIPNDDPAAPALPLLPLAIRRTGPDDRAEHPSAQYLYTLRERPLAWLAPPDHAAQWPVPEIALVQAAVPPATEPAEWIWRRSLLDAEQFENAFAIDDMAYRAMPRLSDGQLMFEYDGDSGTTLRFGDGIFGELPDNGAVFTVRFRIGRGAAGNVAADAVTIVDPASAALVAAVTNPFAASGGSDAESAERVRRLAPQAFRAEQFRAVRPDDYVAAAKKLPWVRAAGSVFRWTGSWLTVFTTADPRGTDFLPSEEVDELVVLLNRYRMAGYESYVPTPRYVALRLIITICAQPDVFKGDVEAAVLAALGSSNRAGGGPGFFFPDNFQFGDPLERSRLEAAIQGALGVAGVLSIQYERIGVMTMFAELPQTLSVGPEQLLRVDNDPSRPLMGSLRVIVEGGK